MGSRFTINRNYGPRPGCPLLPIFPEALASDGRAGRAGLVHRRLGGDVTRETRNEGSGRLTGSVGGFKSTELESFWSIVMLGKRAECNCMLNFEQWFTGNFGRERRWHKMSEELSWVITGWHRLPMSKTTGRNNCFSAPRSSIVLYCENTRQMRRSAIIFPTLLPTYKTSGHNCFSAPRSNRPYCIIMSYEAIETQRTLIL